MDAKNADPLGDDLQLALYMAYEMHYRGFDGVDDDREWDLDLLAARRSLEEAFVEALRQGCRPGPRSQTLDELLTELVAPRKPPAATDDTDIGASVYLARRGQLWQLREYVVHRSLYHLKEAAPQTFLLPRLTGGTQAALCRLLYDELGAGRSERMHSALFAQMMVDLELDPTYGAYLDLVPAPALAIVNAMSLFGLHRRYLGAAIGQLASIEITSSPASDRLARATAALVPEPRGADRFFAEHIEADAVHEQMIRREIITGLVTQRPELTGDIAFGIRVDSFLEAHLARHLLGAWTSGQTSLLDAIGVGDGPGSLQSSAGRPAWL
ncbi:MAG: iron-containing redox enzyme family protein [Acidimicrobiales bacterium]